MCINNQRMDDAFISSEIGAPTGLSLLAMATSLGVLPPLLHYVGSSFKDSTDTELGSIELSD
jgi:hypothetical protein